MNPDNVPTELWMEIFQLLPLPSDLYCVMRTSKRFHDLAIRAIHRHVIWKTPQQVAHNLPVWDANQGMDLATRTLELGVSILPPALPGFIVDVAGHSVWRGEHELTCPINMRLYNTISYHHLERQSFASATLHEAMLARVATFANLENLTLHNILLSDEHFTIIHALPQLRTLRIEFCIIPSRSATQVFNHQTLPIIELALLNLRRRVAEIHGDVLVEEDMMHVLTLALAQNLRTLRIDSTSDVFKHVFNGWQAEAQGHTIPQNLERLYIQRKQLLQPAVAGESTFPDASLYSFLSRANSLTTYSTYHPTPQHQHLHQGTLPLLRCYSGPVESIAGILPNRPIVALQLLQCIHGQHGVHSHRDGIPALTSVASAFPDLQMLSVEFTAWDDEIMHAVSTLFRKLRRLKITYESGGPTEATMVIMGPEFLSRFPDLHTLQMYALPSDDSGKPEHPAWLFDSSFACIEEELRNLVIPWNRWCPALREVQLLSGFTMRRGYNGGAWNLLRLKRLEEVEEFNF